MRILSTALFLTLAACSGAPAASEAQPTADAAQANAATELLADKTTATDAAAMDQAVVGQPAPDFELSDLDGTAFKLSDHVGKTVVVEWFNPGCPYVVHAHAEGPLKDMARTYLDKGVVWVAVNSGAPGKQGHGVETNRAAVTEWAVPNPVLVDEAGAVGRLYGAKTTPHMFVVDPAGTLVYAGALDNAPRGAVPEAGYKPFVQEALDATLAGQPVKTPQTQPWGCSVKYAS